MVLRNRLLAAAGTLLIAFVAGQFVQSSDKIVESAHKPVSETVTPYAVKTVVPLSTATADVHLAAAHVDQVPGLPVAPTAVRNLPALAVQNDAIRQRLTALDDAQEKPEPEGRELNAFGQPCETSFRAKAMDDAMVKLSLRATCHSNEVVEFSQDRLRFSYLLPETGEMELMVPALSDLSVFVAEMRNGDVLTAPVQVPDASLFERVALQWRGETGLQLHAFEYGAAYGELGHVWAQAPQSGDQGGFLTRIGTALPLGGWQAEVYSFPQKTDTVPGAVRLNVEAEVTQSNCNRQILGETLQVDAAGQMQAVELSMSVPACDAVGEYLVLKNILRDMKIAQN
ncbi:hypothetical protein [Actibacterium atlanticum]|uniref:hypothetical protein n=1 Tax=Actibacterium atlanticum TaxID=1461693 RepID=UPI0012DE65BA|nr:hypothetical protein [Actibacterium atlanticum]